MSNLNEAQRKWLEDLFAIGGAGGTRFGLAARAREARFQDDNDNVAGGFAVPDDSSAGTTGSLLQTARMSAPPGGPAPGGPSGGGDGSGIDLTDEERIKLLKEWQKDGKLDGDTQSLRERLRDKRNKPLQKEARKEFDEIRAKIERGEKPKVQPRAADTQPRAVGGRAQQRIERDESPHSTAPKEERISTAGKTKLPDLPDVKKLPEGEQREFGKGLKDDHKQGQT